MSEFVAREDASALEREPDYLQAVERPEVQGGAAAARRAGGDRSRDYLDADAEHDALERRVPMLEARRCPSRPAGDGRMLVGDAAHEAQRRRRSERRRATLDEAVVRSWLRQLGGRSSSRVTTRS